MRYLILDPFHGAAGDMVTAALIGCGADRDRVAMAMGSVVADPAITTVPRCGIQAVRIETRAGHTYRTLEEVLARCDRAVTTDAVRAMAHRVFERIAAAEGRIHGGTPHFHEVGADDAIADVIGACTALQTLGVDGVAVLPIALGRGSVTGSHGTYPVPAPATLAILEGSGLAVRPCDDEGEMLTPTGAALLAEFATVREQDIGPYTIISAGYGAGTRDPPGFPNVLRATIVETVPETTREDCVDILETNIDDASGEVIGNAIARCMEEGARDASAIPLVMKKGRPGNLIRVICTQDRSFFLAALLARELGTLGIRCIPAVHRFIAERTTGEVPVTVEGKMRMIPVKYGWLDGNVYSVKPEFEAAREWAGELGVPVRTVLRAATDAGWKFLKEGHGRHP